MNGVFFMASLPMHREVVRALVRRGVRFDLLDVAEAACGPRSEFAAIAPGAETLDSFRLYRAQPYDDEHGPHSSVDEETMQYLAPHEAATLQMMDRRNADDAPVQELRELYLRYAAMWQYLLNKHRPAAVVFHGTPHQGHDYVLYNLCRRANIATVLLERTFLNERMFIRRDLDDCPQPTDDELSELADELNSSSSPNVPPPSGSHEAGKGTHYEVLNRRINDLSEIQYRLSIPYLLKELIDPRYWTGLQEPVTDTYYGIAGRRPSMLEYRKADWRSRWTTRRGLQAYQRLAVRPDLGADYVYLALHYQPERTTVPDGGLFADQLNIARLLAESLPEGWQLYVREHPRQFRRPLIYSKVRSSGFYERLAAIPRVKLISLDFPAQELVGRSRAAATVTGSTSWEAVQAGRPGLVFGHAWYRHCPGVVTIDDAAGCERALAAIAAGRFTVDRRKVAAFARWVSEHATFRGCFTEGILKLSGLTHAENGELVATAVEQTLNQLSTDSTRKRAGTLT